MALSLAMTNRRDAPIAPLMPKAEHISLRINVTPALYARIGEFKHAKQFETRAQAMVVLLNAGLAALAAPISMPKPVAEATPPAKPRPVRRRPDPYAGADPTEHT